VARGVLPGHGEDGDGNGVAEVGAVPTVAAGALGFGAAAGRARLFAADERDLDPVAHFDLVERGTDGRAALVLVAGRAAARGRVEDLGGRCQRDDIDVVATAAVAAPVLVRRIGGGRVAFRRGADDG